MQADQPILDPQALDDLARLFALAALDELLREAAATTENRSEVAA